MKRFGGAAAAVWMLGTALLGAIPVRAETEALNGELPELEADDKDPVIDRQSLRAANNNPITARRRALRNDLTTLIERLPSSLDASIAAMPQADKEKAGGEAGLQALKAKYEEGRKEATRMREKVSKRMYGSSLESLESRYPSLRNEMFSVLYQVEAHRHFNDPQRFREYTQKKIDIQAAIDIAQKQKASKARRDTLAKYERTLSGNPDLAELERIYDNMNARQVDSRQAVITTDVQANTNSSAFVSGVKISPVGSEISAFKPQPKSQTFRVTVPPPSVATRAYIPIQPYAPPPSDWSYSDDEISGSEFGKFMKVNAPSSAGAKAVFTKAINAVSKWSDSYKLNPLLVMSFMGQESLFVGWERARTVVSHAGAGGLMQLMPGTARAMGVTDRWDVDQNIMGGAKYIRDQRKNFSNEAEFRKLDAIMAWGAQQVVQQGRNAKQVWNEVWSMVPTGVKNAIGAYNSGPGRIWQFGGYANLPNWLRETKNYVPGVLQKYFQHSIDYLKRGGNAPVVA